MKDFELCDLHNTLSIKYNSLQKTNMQQYPTFFNESDFWISLFALLFSGLACVDSWRSRKISACALNISKLQEQRYQPQLTINLYNGYRRYLPEYQTFVFLMSISNPTDINNSIARSELQIKYFLSNDIMANCLIHHDENLNILAESANIGKTPIFSIPIHIDAHKTVVGWFQFAIEKKLMTGKTIDSYKIFLEDSHGMHVETEPLVVRDWKDETA